jgi:hypothetical protein
MISHRLAVFVLASAALAGCQDAAGPSAPAASCDAAVRLDLAPGETRALNEAQARCFALGANGAGYVLAGFDARALDASAAGPFAGELPEPRYTLGDGAGEAAASQNLVAADGGADRPTGDLRLNTATAPGDPYARETPWRAGERFQVRPMVGAGTVPARVVKVVGGRFVLAVLEGDESGAGRVLDQAETALEFLAAQGVPVLRAALGETVPVTSPGSGQLLILAAAWNPEQGAGATWSREDAGGARSLVWLNVNVRPGKGENFEMYDHVSYRLKVLAHEMTHAWQVQHLRGAHGAPHAAPGSAAWSIEGGADFLAMDLLRRYLGVGLTANWDWQDHLNPRESAVIYALEPADARGRLPWGYYDAASLLRDLQLRLMNGGLSADDAMAVVARGAVEGWYGDDGAGGACHGLVERLRGHLGAAWDPAEAVLTWTLTQAADDRTSNRALNNPVYRKVGDRGAAYGWKPSAEVQAGRAGASSFGQVSGGSFFALVSGAGTVSATSDTPGIRWMIARTN